MPIRIVRLGDAREEGEGLRIGTVRRPPRGVPKEEFATRNFYDVWLPALAPSEALMKIGKEATTDADWKKFVKKFKDELKQPDTAKVLDLLVALSHQTSFSVGCYCEQEARCHRSILREVLQEKAAQMVASRGQGMA